MSQPAAEQREGTGGTGGTGGTEDEGSLRTRGHCDCG